MASPVSYNVSSVAKGVNGFGSQFCSLNYTSTLGAGVEATVTVPAVSAIGMPSNTTYNRFLAVFSCESPKKIYAALNATAAVPAGNTLLASTSELLPPGLSAKQVKAGQVIHVISAAAADISISFYPILD